MPRAQGKRKKKKANFLTTIMFLGDNGLNKLAIALTETDKCKM